MMREHKVIRYFIYNKQNCIIYLFHTIHNMINSSGQNLNSIVWYTGNRITKLIPLRYSKVVTERETKRKNSIRWIYKKKFKLKPVSGIGGTPPDNIYITYYNIVLHYIHTKIHKITSIFFFITYTVYI